MGPHTSHPYTDIPPHDQHTYTTTPYASTERQCLSKNSHKCITYSCVSVPGQPKPTHTRNVEEITARLNLASRTTVKRVVCAPICVFCVCMCVRLYGARAWHCVGRRTLIPSHANIYFFPPSRRCRCQRPQTHTRETQTNLE